MQLEGGSKASPDAGDIVTILDSRIDKSSGKSRQTVIFLRPRAIEPSAKVLEQALLYTIFQSVVLRAGVY